jgi:hypothetical protein
MVKTNSLLKKMKHKSKSIIGPVEFIDRVIQARRGGRAVYPGAVPAPRARNGKEITMQLPAPERRGKVVDISPRCRDVS